MQFGLNYMLEATKHQEEEQKIRPLLSIQQCPIYSPNIYSPISPILKLTFFDNQSSWVIYMGKLHVHQLVETQVWELCGLEAVQGGF